MRPDEQVDGRLHRDGCGKSIQILFLGDTIPFCGKHILQFVSNANTSVPLWGFRHIRRTFDLLILDILFHLVAWRLGYP